MPIGVGKAIRGFGRALKSAKSGTVKVDPKYKDPMGKTKVEAQKIKAKYIKKGLKEPKFEITKKEIETAKKIRAKDKKVNKQVGAAVAGGAAAAGGVKLAAEKGPEPVKKFLKSEPKIVDGKLKLVDTRKKKNDKKNKK
jgi:hypothetical protein